MSKTTSGTNMSQEDYEKLKKSADNNALSESEAIILINKEFGFEASRIKIMIAVEIDVSEPNSRYLEIEKKPRKPLYEATDWNYIRFNIITRSGEWTYEMVNGNLHFVNI